MFNLQFKYYVIFFNEDKVEYAWIRTKDLKPFKSIECNKLVKKVFAFYVNSNTFIVTSITTLITDKVPRSRIRRLVKESMRNSCEFSQIIYIG